MSSLIQPPGGRVKHYYEWKKISSPQLMSWERKDYLLPPTVFYLLLNVGSGAERN